MLIATAYISGKVVRKMIGRIKKVAYEIYVMLLHTVPTSECCENS